MGEVFSRDVQFSALWGPMAFHAVSTGLGALFVGRATAGKGRQAGVSPQQIAQQTKP